MQVTVLTRVLTVVEDLDDLDRTVASLDLQTVPAAALEIDVLLGAVDPAGAGRLAALASRRPQLHLMSRAGRPTGDLLAALAARPGAERILVLPPGGELHAQALARLVQRAEQSGSDAVEGLASGEGPTVVLAEQALAVTAASDLPPEPGAALERWRADIVQRARAAARLDDYAAVRGNHPDGDLVDTGAVRVRWEGSELLLEVDLDAPGGGEAPWLVGHDVASGAEHRFPTVAAPTNDAPGRVTARLDLASTASAGGLPDGTWRLALGRGGQVAHRAALPRVPLPPAVVDGRAVATSRRDERLTLQVGRVRGLLTRTPVTGTRVEETHRGSLLRVDLGGLHLTGAEPFRGRLVLGGLGVPAQIHRDESGVHLRAWVSGLAGTYELEAAFAAPRARPLGLALTVAGDGTMRVGPSRETTRTRPEAASAPGQVLTRPPVGGRAAVGRLRRALRRRRG